MLPLTAAPARGGVYGVKREGPGALPIHLAQVEGRRESGGGRDGALGFLGFRSRSISKSLHLELERGRESLRDDSGHLFSSLCTLGRYLSTTESSNLGGVKY